MSGSSEPAAEARAALEARWLRLTRETLPGLAGDRAWPVRFDHCFQRILLDNACDTVWYDRIPKRPAYAHAPDDILTRAVSLGEAAIRGETDMDVLDDNSLKMRAKPSKSRRRA